MRLQSLFLFFLSFLSVQDTYYVSLYTLTETGVYVRGKSRGVGSEIGFNGQKGDFKTLKSYFEKI